MLWIGSAGLCGPGTGTKSDWPPYPFCSDVWGSAGGDPSSRDWRGKGKAPYLSAGKFWDFSLSHRLYFWQRGLETPPPLSWLFTSTVDRSFTPRKTSSLKAPDFDPKAWVPECVRTEFCGLEPHLPPPPPPTTMCLQVWLGQGVLMGGGAHSRGTFQSRPLD